MAGGQLADRTRWIEIVFLVWTLGSGWITRRWPLVTLVVVADATGVGMPVVEMLQDAGLKARIVPVTITRGGSARRDGGLWHVPRRWSSSRGDCGCRNGRR